MARKTTEYTCKWCGSTSCGSQNKARTRRCYEFEIARLTDENYSLWLKMRGLGYEGGVAKHIEWLEREAKKHAEEMSRMRQTLTDIGAGKDYVLRLLTNPRPRVLFRVPLPALEGSAGIRDQYGHTVHRVVTFDCRVASLEALRWSDTEIFFQLWLSYDRAALAGQPQDARHYATINISRDKPWPQYFWTSEGRVLRCQSLAGKEHAWLVVQTL